MRKAFSVLTGVLDRLGPHELVPVKTMILLSATANFGGVVVRRGSLDLGFFLTRRLQHPRVNKVERLSPRKFAHHVHLSGPAEVDQEVVAWLTEAYVDCVIGGRAR